MSGFTPINPPGLGAPRGFSHGLLAPEGWRLLFVAGQTAPDQGEFAAQFAAVLDKIIAVVRTAGGRPEHIGRMTVYVTDLDAYLASRTRLRDAWRERLGNHYPAMALLAVTRLVEAGALVEIEATAMVPA